MLDLNSSELLEIKILLLKNKFKKSLTINKIARAKNEALLDKINRELKIKLES